MGLLLMFIAEGGAVILDADKVGHEVFKPDTGTWRKAVADFGTSIFIPSGDVLTNCRVSDKLWVMWSG